MVRNYNVKIFRGGIRIGCMLIQMEEVKNLFYWYFFEPDKYRFLLWDNGGDVVNIYRKGREVIAYTTSSDEFTEEYILKLFIKVSKELHNGIK